MIHGPFGTGKTRTLVELISQETRQGHKVLATAESNAAVDNILERLMDNKKLNLTRLGHPQRVSKHNISQTLAYKVENHKLNKKIKKIYKKIDNKIEKEKRIQNRLHSIAEDSATMTFFSMHPKEKAAVA